MNSDALEQWVDRIFESSGATQLGDEFQDLADGLADRVSDDPIAAARVIAVLIQSANSTD